ncbi:MAG TPA: zf-HC2 domain-containing protein [Bacillota bacterium]|nr:zf-HC2 domain-containing protein [Bacillota bacterium]
MKCITAMGLMSAYVEHVLPEQTARAVRFHIQICADCHTEYIIWKESSALFQTGMQHIIPVDKVSNLAMAEEIMARITKEEKRKRSVPSSLLRLLTRMKKFSTSLAVLFLLVFGVMMVGSFQKDSPSPQDQGGWKELSTANIVLSIDQMRASSDVEVESDDNRYRLVASIGDPLHFANAAVPMPNVGLVAGFFGIMVTVVSMSWLSRN